MGMTLASGHATSTSTNRLSGYYARGKVMGTALGVYGTWRPARSAEAYEGLYVDGSVQRVHVRNRVEGVALAPERYGSRGWQSTLEAGYVIRMGSAVGGGIFLEPQVQLGYNHWDDLRHTEVNGTEVTARNVQGLHGRVGLRLSGVTRGDAATPQVQPYLAANWLRTRAHSQVWMDNEQVVARIPSSRAEVSAGAWLKLSNGLGAWAALARQQAGGYHLTSAQLGVRYHW